MVKPETIQFTAKETTMNSTEMTETIIYPVALATTRYTARSVRMSCTVTMEMTKYMVGAIMI